MIDRRRAWLTVGSAWAVALIVPAPVAWGRSHEAQSDSTISDQVKFKLASNKEVKGGDLTVDVRDGVVTLSGEVNTQRQKDQAAEIARHVHGVKQVINNIGLQ